MKSQALRPLLTALRRPADDRRVSDRQLLQYYLDQGDESAFAVLVGRHGPRVRAACRQVLADEADVDDAFQATFLVLLDKARSMYWRPALGGWLFGVAHRVALRARTRAAARHRHESRVVRPASRPDVDLSWREAVAVLHEELDRLPDPLRLPLLLCYLDGLSRDEAAQQLGWTPGTVKGRLERGRLRLRDRLARRGITLTTGLLAVLGNSGAACTVPPRLVQTTLQAVARRALPAPALAHGVPPIMWKNYTGLLAGLLLVALAVGGSHLLSHAGTVPAVSATGHLEERPRRTEPPPRDKPSAPESITVQGRVLGPDGKPRADVDVYLDRDTTASVAAARRAISGKDGRFSFRLDPTPFAKAPGRADSWRDARVVAVADGLGPAWATAGRATEGGLSLRLVSDLPLEGRILTLEGRPVAGARVRLRSLTAWASEAELSAHLRAVAAGDAPPRPFGFLGEVPGRSNEWKTDDQGRVRITGLGRDRLAGLEVTGPGIAHDTILAVTRAGKPVIGRPGPYWATIYPATFEHAAKPGRVLAGKAIDATTGRPIAGIFVQSAGAPPKTVTDAEGRYELAGLPKANKYILYVQPARGDVPYIAVRIDVTDTTGVGPLRADLRIPRGIPLRVQVKEPATGKLLRSGVSYVSYVPLYPNKNAPENLPGLMLGTKLEPDGSYRGAVLPGPGAICVMCSGGDYLPAAVNQKTFFRLDRVPRDEKILPASEVLWTAGPNSNPLPQRQFQVIELIDPSAGAKEVSLTLKPDPGKSATIRLQDADGHPLTGVRVWDWRRGEEWGPPLAAAGLKVSGLGPGRPRYLVFRHEGRKLAGTVIVRGEEAGTVTVALQPWGTATGRLVDTAGKPLPRHELRGRNAPTGRDRALTLPGAVRTDDEGKFRLDGLVPGGEYYLMASKYLPQVGEFIGVGHLADPVTVRPGETKDLGDVQVRRIGK